MKIKDFLSELEKYDKDLDMGIRIEDRGDIFDIKDIQKGKFVLLINAIPTKLQ